MARLHIGSRALRMLAALMLMVSVVAVFVPSSSAAPTAPADHDETDECGHHDHGACPAEQPALTIVLSIKQGEVRVRVGVRACGYEAGVVADLVFGASQSSGGITVLD
ncbi:MAG: hypothetical protein ACRD0U_13345, partial [Acidimicrobiales bacterium]